ncbi:MAG: hypothetical protein WAZ19_04430 [Anaerolineae bacterium]
MERVSRSEFSPEATVQRLGAALRQGQQVSGQLSRLLGQAEEEAAEPFRGGPASGQYLAASTVTQDRDQPAPPGAPAYPDQPASHDGSGEHGMLGSATDADWKTHRKEQEVTDDLFNKPCLDCIFAPFGVIRRSFSKPSCHHCLQRNPRGEYPPCHF